MLYTDDAGECRHDRALLSTITCRLVGLALVLVLAFQPNLDFHFTKVLKSHCNLHIWQRMLHPLLVSILIFSFAMLTPPCYSCRVHFRNGGCHWEGAQVKRWWRLYQRDWSYLQSLVREQIAPGAGQIAPGAGRGALFLHPKSTFSTCGLRSKKHSEAGIAPKYYSVQY